MEYKKLITLSYTDKEAYQKTFDARFHNECTTRPNIEIAGNPAFYVTNQELLMLITKIDGVDKKLTQATEKLPTLAILQYSKQLLIDEIKQTNDIENVYSTKKQIKDTFEKIEKNKDKGRFSGLIRKYFLLGKEDIALQSCEDIRALYDEIVLPEVMEEDATDKPDGVLFRKSSVSLYSDSGKEIHIGVFPEQKIISALSAALKILNDERVNYLISAAIFHYLFAYIHPFYNGNGRTDRFISSYYISKYLNPLVAYRFSYVIKKHKSQYYKLFSDTNDKRNKGDLTPFIIQFMEWVLEAEKELLDEIRKRKSQLEYYENSLRNLPFSEGEKEVGYYLLSNALFDDEGLSVTKLQWITGKAYNTVKKSIDRLNRQGFLRITKAGKSILYEMDLDRLS